MEYINVKWNDTIDISKDQWKEIFLNKDIIKPYNKDLILKIYKKTGYSATATEIANEEGKHSSSYNSALGALGKRITKYFGIEAPRQKEDITKFNWWHVPFLGDIQKESSHFIWILRPELKEAIDELIKENKIVVDDVLREVIYIPEEISLDKFPKLKEGAKYQININAYERNQTARRECIEYYKKLNNGKVICEICSFDFGAFYGDIAEGKIHVHHVRALHEIGEEYEVNAIKDLIPICPNCHLVVHTKEPAYTPQQIKKMLASRKLLESTTTSEL